MNCSITRIQQPIFDFVFFTFPIHYPRNGHNKRLMRDFFTFVINILQDNGEIRLAFLPLQFKQWDVENYTENCELKLSQTSECHWENLFVPTDGYGHKEIPTDPMWYNITKIPHMLPW
jgi:tRNA G46 methylase TrmB